MLEKSKLFFTSYWHYFLFTFISLSVYKDVFGFDFVNLDDHLQVTDNIRIQKLSFQQIKILFTTSTVNMYQPLTSLILAILFSFAKFTAGYYHLFSLWIHIFNGFLVYNVILKLFKNKTTSVVATLLFLTNPIMVESVLWVSATSTLLYTFFFLLSFISYLNFYELGKKKYYYLTLFFFVLGVFCKIQMITFVGVLFLIDWLYSKKNIQLQKIIQKIPFIIITGIFVVVAFFFREAEDSPLELNYNSWLLAPNQVIWYLYKYLIPFSLTVLYDWPDIFGIREYLFSFLFIILLFSSYKLRKNKMFVFGILIFLLIISIHTSLFIQFLAPYADRYGYLPYLGFLIALISLVSKVKNQTNVFFTSIAFVLLFSYLSSQQIKIWKNSETLWTHNLKSQKNITANINRINYLMNSNKQDKALKDINIIIKSKIAKTKEKSTAYYDLGIINFNKGNLYIAEKCYLKSIELDAKKYESLYNLGNLYSEKGNYLKAIETYTKGIAINNTFYSLYKNSANAHYQIQQYKQALEDINKAIEIDNKKRPIITTRDSSLQAFKKELLLKIQEKKTKKKSQSSKATKSKS